MKSFIITNFENKLSRKIADRHVDKMREFGDFEIELYEGVKGPEAFYIFQVNELQFLSTEFQNEIFRKRNLERNYHAQAGVAGCFASHFLLWKKCVNLNETIGIFEYDAFQVRKLPKKLNFDNILYLSAWRNFKQDPDDYWNDKTPSGIHPYEGYDRWGFRNCMSGTHAYMIHPHAAKVCIEVAKTKGWFPADRYFSTDIVPLTKQTISPAVFVVRDSQNLTNLYKVKNE